VRISAQVDFSAWEAELEALGERLDRQRLQDTISAAVRADLLDQFQTAGDPAWQALSPHTVAKKRYAGYPRKSRDGSIPANLVQQGGFGPENILIMTGALLASWTQDDAPGHVESFDGDTFEIGSEVAYAATHQFGAWAMLGGRRVYIPSRPLRIREEALKGLF